MTDQELLWQATEGSQSIVRMKRPTEQTISILSDTIWGSRATRYRIKGLASKLARLRDPSFFVLREADTELSVFVLDHCKKKAAGEFLDGYHFVMASTLPDRQNEGLAGRLVDTVRSYCETALPGKGVGFAYVEATTEFSLRLSDRIGHAVEADFPLTLFSRLRPTEDANVRPLGLGERATLIHQLDVLYADHELTDFDIAVRGEDYLVFEQDGHLAAGAQVEVLHWSVVSMPGVAGWFLLKALPRIPILRGILDLSDLRIVRFGNLLIEPGREGDFVKLAGTALAREGAKIGLIMLDRRSPVLERILRHDALGLLSGALKGSAKLRLDAVGMSDAQIARLVDAPLHASAADVF